MSVRVIGIGNRLRRDDGVAPILIDMLKEQSLPGVDLRVCLCEPASMIDALDGAKNVLIIDASQPAGSPGEVIRIKPSNMTALTSKPTTSTHGFGLPEALALAGSLGSSPERTIILAIEGADFSHGEGLSAPLQRALPSVLQAIYAEIDSMPGTSGAMHA